MALRDLEQEPQSVWGSVAVLALAVGGVAVGWWTCSRGPSFGPPNASPAASASAPNPSASASASAAPTAAPIAVVEPRCADISSDAFVIGEAPPPRPTPAPTSDWGATPLPEEPDDILAPFAVEVGRGAVFEGGFAVGTLRDAEGGTVAMVATLGLDGKNGKLVRLARSRGDLEPPIVTGAGPALLAAMLEPNAAGRAIKVAKITGGEVTWGPELSEGRDDSLALDIAASGERAVVVWDDVPKDAKRSTVMIASFDTASLRSVTRGRPVSPPSTDAESPRVIARPGGYWLAYTARASEDDEDGKAKKGKAKKGKLNEDTAAAGETIAKRWIEVMPLDESGAATAAPRAVTSKDGHILAFDMELGEGGAALLAFRDDDTPSGSSGGRVSSLLVRPGGGGEPRVIAEEGVGTGVPDLLPGWIAVASISGPTRLATMTDSGDLIGALLPEPSLGGGGEPIAAIRDTLLIARPAGRAMKLSVSKCALTPPAAPPAPAGDAPPSE
jgi:hypothetical protein